MGIVSIQNFTGDLRLGLWHISESTGELMSQVDLAPDEILLLGQKKTGKKQREWLACRNLLRRMISSTDKIGYDDYGKPYLSVSKQHISISHSGDYACIYISEIHPVGVDIQKLKASISAGSDFFLHISEYEWVNPEDNLELHLIWSVKESVFKMMGIPNLDFKKDIKLNPFKGNQNVPIEVSLCDQAFKGNISVRFAVFEDYVLTWTL